MQKVLVLQLAASAPPIFGSTHHNCKIAWHTWVTSQEENKILLKSGSLTFWNGPHSDCRVCISLNKLSFSLLWLALDSFLCDAKNPHLVAISGTCLRRGTGPSTHNSLSWNTAVKNLPMQRTYVQGSFLSPGRFHMLHNYRKPFILELVFCDEKPPQWEVHVLWLERSPPFAATSERLRVAKKTQHSQK